MKKQKHYLNVGSHFNIGEFVAEWNALIIIRLPLPLVVEIVQILFFLFVFSTEWEGLIRYSDWATHDCPKQWSSATFQHYFGL